MAKRIATFFLLALALVTGLYLAVVFGWAYSSGERAGWVQKFSSKGWICKTWEGELVMVAQPGAVPEKFLFTVRDAAVAAQIGQAVGQRVTLHYEQHRGVPTSCFGETEYWVDSLSTLAPPPLSVPPAPEAAAPGAPAAPPAPPPAH